jgi:hypothetical protein
MVIIALVVQISILSFSLVLYLVSKRCAYQNYVCRIVFTWLRIGPLTGCCEYGDRSDSTEGEVINKLGDCYLVKKIVFLGFDLAF